jgi:hypothetical protein
MSKTIWKFELSLEHPNIEMPAGAQILHIATQRETPCIWALVNPKAPTMTRYLRVYGTGHPMPNDPGAYLGTFQLHGGSLIFHVFENVPTDIN